MKKYVNKGYSYRVFQIYLTNLYLQLFMPNETVGHPVYNMCTPTTHIDHI